MFSKKNVFFLFLLLFYYYFITFIYLLFILFDFSKKKIFAIRRRENFANIAKFSLWSQSFVYNFVSLITFSSELRCRRFWYRWKA